MVSIVWLLAFFAICLVTAALASRRIKGDVGEGFVLSRTLGGVVSGLSSGATANSGFIVIGAVGMGYSMGVASLLYPLAWLVGDVAFWMTCARRIYVATDETGALSVPELISNGRKWRAARVVSAAIIVLFLTVYLVGQMSSAVKALQGQVQVDPSVIIVTFGLLVAIYTAMGGFLSSVWTDVLQAVAMLVLVCCVLGWLIAEVGGGPVVIDKLRAVDSSLVDVLSGVPDGASIIKMLAFSFVAFGFGLSQPQVTTRLMGINSRAHVVTAAITHISFVQITWIGMSVIGMYLRLVVPSIDDPETALPMVAIDRFGAMGPLVIVGMFAAIVSSADSLMLGASTAVTWDLAGRSHGSKQGGAIHRVAVALVAAAAALMAMFWEESVFSVSVFAASGLAATVGVAVFAMIFQMRRSNLSTCIAMVVGLAACIGWRYLTSNMYSLDALIGFGSGMVALLVLRPMREDGST